MPTIQIAPSSDTYIRSDAPTSGGNGVQHLLGSSATIHRRILETYGLSALVGKVIVTALTEKDLRKDS